MAQILVRGLEDSIVEALKRHAKLSGRSLQSEVKTILEKAASEPHIDMEAARKMSLEFRRRFKGRRFPNTVELIHEDHNN